MEEDIRWQQRFANYNKAFSRLAKGVTHIQERQQMHQSDTANDIVDDMIKEALIQRFEYTHELAWNVMRDYARYQGNFEVAGSRDATREAFKLNLISDGDVWMDMIKSRNLSSHTYKEETFHKIFEKVMILYYPAFLTFQATMNSKLSA